MAKKQSKSSKTALTRQEDAKAPLDAAAFLAATGPVLKTLQADLLSRADGSASVVSALRARWSAETEAHRTADVFEVWRRNLVAQVAAAWLLSVVFVRTLEDRGLLDRNRIAGPGALDSQQQFLQLAPYLSERDYLLEVFRELTRIPAAAAMFDARHSLVWLLAPSAEGARALLALFRAPEADAPAYRFGQSDTRFLGDLYQDLDEDVRARYALLQTPHFIESFILDRTLERSIEEFGLDATTMIDPTCGSGHFLLGAFDRLFERRMVATPGLDPREAVRLALEAVHGVDINPYSIAIARVRLTLAALEKGGYTKLKTAPVLPLNLVVADSLLHRVGEGQASFGDARGQSVRAWKGEAFALEDEEAAKDLLAKRFAVVVGNPPYITVKDAALRETYRAFYPRSASGKYSVAAPFTERFFGLAQSHGFVGMITANSFMKREFGKKLIEEYLPTINLEYVMNTSGAFIPGHGTPTVLLFGRHEPPAPKDVLGVLAKRGEPSTPADPEKGLVWQSIADHWSEIGFENDYVSIANLQRTTLGRHPWSLGGGGASELKELLEDRCERRLGDAVDDIGFASFTGLDDAFIAPAIALLRRGVEESFIRPMVIGESIRDWSMQPAEGAVTPYTPGTEEPTALDQTAGWARFLWPFRTNAENVASFGGKTRKEEGQSWWHWYRWQKERYACAYRIAFAFVATHNHFVLDRGGKVFNRSAPIIKLPDGATEDDHLALLAYLNSSTACFWMKQVFFPKTSGTNVGDVRGQAARIAYEFAGTGLMALPIPDGIVALAPFAAEMERLAALRSTSAPRAVLRRNFDSSTELRDALSAAATQDNEAFERQVFIQEEIDWRVYVLFGLVDPACTQGDALLGTGRMQPGERQFVRGGLPDADDAAPWSARRMAGRLPALQLIEDPLHKRPWFGVQGVFHRDGWTFEEHTKEALREHLLDEVEEQLRRTTIPSTARAVTAAAKTSSSFRCAAELAATPNPSDAELTAGLLLASAVPFLAAYRLTESGLEKRAAWENTWSRQRDEDSGRACDIAVPPKYDIKDFRDISCWSSRGKLDVPKERFISYPGCESEQDKSPVYGWAGWNHLQQAQALAALYLSRKNDEGWKAERLVPMLAGILELVPWVKQWHNEPNAEFGGERLGDYFARFVDDECRALAVSHDDLRAWRPTAKGSGRARKVGLSSSEDATAGASPADSKKRRTSTKQAADATRPGDENIT